MGQPLRDSNVLKVSSATGSLGADSGQKPRASRLPAVLTRDLAPQQTVQQALQQTVQHAAQHAAGRSREAQSQTGLDGHLPSLSPRPPQQRPLQQLRVQQNLQQQSHPQILALQSDASQVTANQQPQPPDLSSTAQQLQHQQNQKQQQIAPGSSSRRSCKPRQQQLQQDVTTGTTQTQQVQANGTARATCTLSVVATMGGQHDLLKKEDGEKVVLRNPGGGCQETVVDVREGSGKAGSPLSQAAAPRTRKAAGLVWKVAGLAVFCVVLLSVLSISVGWQKRPQRSRSSTSSSSSSHSSSSPFLSVATGSSAMVAQASSPPSPVAAVDSSAERRNVPDQSTSSSSVSLGMKVGSSQSDLESSQSAGGGSSSTGGISTGLSEGAIGSGSDKILGTIQTSSQEDLAAVSLLPAAASAGLSSAKLASIHSRISRLRRSRVSSATASSSGGDEGGSGTSSLSLSSSVIQESGRASSGSSSSVEVGGEGRSRNDDGSSSSVPAAASEETVQQPAGPDSAGPVAAGAAGSAAAAVQEAGPVSGSSRGSLSGAPGMLGKFARSLDGCETLPDVQYGKGAELSRHYPVPRTYDRAECACTPVHNFVILSMQRSGSGWFETFLNSHPNISSHGEIFGKHPRRENMSTIAATLDTLYNLEWESSATKNDSCTSAVGLKWMLNQGAMEFKSDVIDYFRRNHVSVIMLMRRNVLRRLVSILANAYDRKMRLLDGEHKSHTHSPEEAKKLAAYKPTVGTRHLEGNLQRVQDIMDDAMRAFNSTRMIVVYYEDVVKNRTILNDVQRFLGVPPMELTTRQVKIHTKTLRDTIANYDEVERKLRGSALERLLNEDY